MEVILDALRRGVARLGERAYAGAPPRLEVVSAQCLSACIAQ
jgi:hypothetical protein